LFALVSLLTANTLAGAQWSVNASMQGTKGNYVFTTITNSYYLYTGLRYRASKWNVSAILPIVAQNNDLVTRTGGMFLPTGGSHHDQNGSVPSHHGSMMSQGMGASNMSMGLGDLYLIGERQLFGDYLSGPVMFTNVQIKFPTANKAMNYGTGEFDFGMGLSLRQKLGSFAGFVDIGYLILGDPAGVTFKDPLTFGAGIGKFLLQEKLSLLLYYQGYSQILAGYAPPRQLSLGGSYRVNPRVTLTGSGLVGLSETAPDFSFLTGFEWQF